MMLGIDERALRVVWTVFLFGLALVLIYLIRDTLLVFALAVMLAYVLSPLVTLTQRILPQRRNLALAAVYTILIGLLVLAGFLVIPKLVDQATNLGQRLPALLSSNRLESLPLPSWLEPLRQRAIDVFNSDVAQIGSRVLPFVREAGTRILSGLGALLPLILIPILAFFFLKDGEKLKASFLVTIDQGPRRVMVQQILEDLHAVLRNYIRALVTLSISAFICWWLFLTIMRYPYEVLLAGVAGVLEFIPVVGPVSAAVIIILVCAVSGSGGLLWIALFFALYRVFADYVLNPYLMSSGIEIHPVLVLFAVLAGETIAGIPGMFFSVPAMATLRILYLNLRGNQLHKKLTEEGAVNDSQGRIPSV